MTYLSFVLLLTLTTAVGSAQIVGMPQTQSTSPLAGGEVIEEETTTTRRVVRKTTDSLSPSAISPVAAGQAAPPVAAKPPPPPEPPATEASDPRRIVRYFCRAWKDGDYKRMYWAMDAGYRKNKTLKKFSALLESDKEFNGGLADENITVDDTTIGGNTQVTVDLRFTFKNARDRRVKALVTKTLKGYRIVNSGIVPVDMNDL